MGGPAGYGSVRCGPVTRLWWSLVLLLGSACARNQRLPVRMEDVYAWSGVNVIELQMHPFFSTLPKREEVLSDGRRLWTYANCTATPVTCRPRPFGQTECTGGNQVCCHNQFVVAGDVVEAYRPVGTCATNCSVRPASRACR